MRDSGFRAGQVPVIGAILWGVAALTLALPARANDVVVFAAASLRNAFDDLAMQWKREAGRRAVISYAASPALARQIEHGAPADIFISADLDWMDYLERANAIRKETRSNLLGNRIVLIASADSTASILIAPGFNLPGLLGNGRLAMANTDAVPAGRYGKAALESLGAWANVAGRVAQAENVRAALLLVARGEAPLGIVYQTDAAVDGRVRIVGTFTQDTHPSIIYPIAATTQSLSPWTAAFLAYVKGPASRAIFARHGFAVRD